MVITDYGSLKICLNKEYILKKICKVFIAAFLILGVATTIVMADAAKGQRLYTKKLKSVCSFSGTKMAAKHTQDEWKEIKDAGKLKDEIKKLCQNTPDKALKDKFIKHYFDFFYKYASDSGNVPSCVN